MSRSRAWLFTLNNYTDGDEAVIRSLSAVYLCYGHEVAPSTGTPHLQGYVYLQHAKSMTAVKAMFAPAQPHFERANGTPAQNRAYCSKEDTTDFYEVGELPRQGKRSDLERVRSAIVAEPQITEEKLFDEHFPPMVRYHRSIMRYKAIKQPSRDFKTEVFWFSGPTGTGKSRDAFGLHPHAYSKSTRSKWWDGYDGQDVVIIDDLRPRDFEFTFLLQLFDRYPLLVEVKGGTLKFTSRKIIVTTSMSLEEFSLIAASISEDPQQLVRRVEHQVSYEE